LEKNEHYKVTVFTSTFNRGYRLSDAYKSLCRQTIKDFEWLIVDDGSTDNTEYLVQNWQNECSLFPIRYIKVPNGGKHRAINRGVKLAQGELFLILDSDDYLTDNAIELIKKWEATIATQKDQFCGVVGLRCTLDGTPLGTTFKGLSLDCYYRDNLKYGITGDKAEAFYTDVIKAHPFPEFEGEKFISEGVTWTELSYKEHKKLRYFNESIMRCEYIQDGLSHNWKKLLLNNPQGVLSNIKKEIEYTKPSYIRKLKLWQRYVFVADGNNYGTRKLKNDLQISSFDYFMLRSGKLLMKFTRTIKHKGKT
jgi:glycosyltransferase involved in cell wall biosynthesis